MLPRLRSTLHALLGRSRFEDETAEELRFHHETRVEHLVSTGLSPAEARRQARLEFGAVERVREECREARGLRWFDTFRRNVAFAFRRLRREPVFAGAAVCTLALCIGANTAVYSLVDAALFRPLPYPEPSRLAMIVVAFQKGSASGEQSAQTGRVWEAVRDHAPSLIPAAYSGLGNEVNLAGGHVVERVLQQRVSARFFEALGVGPLLGRGFSTEEDRPGGPAVVVLSYAAWQRLLDGSRSVIGTSVFLRGEPHTVVGVMPPHFQTDTRADVWTPLRPSMSGEGGGSNYTVIARVRPGASWAAAEAEMAALSGDVLREVDLPAGASARLHLVPLQRGLAEGARPALLVLLGAVGVVLLIGCTNVAGLLLAAGARRVPELATRIALGSGRRTVIGQLLTESLVLALVGGACGVLLGRAVLAALSPSALDVLGVWQHVGLDVRVLTASMAIAAATSVAFGLFPAVRATSVDVRAALVDGGGRAVAGGRRAWPRRLLVVTEVALGLALIVLAGLLLRTFVRLDTQPPGFDPSGVLAAEVSLQDARYRSTVSVTRLFSASLDRIGRIPGVQAAGVILTLPYERALNLGFRMPGRSDSRITSACYVTPDVFRALGMRLARGRWLAESDGPEAARVLLVNEAFAAHYFKGKDVLGESLRIEGGNREVVGIVGNVPQRSGWGEFGPMAPVPTVYLPAAQLSDAILPLVHTWFSPRWVVRAANSSGALGASIQAAMSSTDPLLAVGSIRDLEAVRADGLASQRLRAQLLGGLALLALVLSSVGVYGLISQSVEERRHELGIRLALGARVSRVIGEVAGQGLVLAALGVAAGAMLAANAAPLLRNAVWGVPLLDPWTFGVSAAGLLAVTVLASVVPALRIATIDPARALRHD